MQKKLQSDSIGHILGIAAFVITLIFIWLYSLTEGKTVDWTLNVMGISLEIIGFILMLWAATRKINLPRGIIFTGNNDDKTPSEVMASPHPLTWLMGIIFVVIGLSLQLIAVFTS